jgi:hypothetical protein
MTLKIIPKSFDSLSTLVFLLSLFFSLLVAGTTRVNAQKNPKPEDIVERSIIAYGTRAAIYSVQRNGMLKALVTFNTPDGTREGRSTTKFIRKQRMSEDLRMIELDLPQTKYIIGYDGKEMWSVQDGQVTKPSEQEIRAFRAGHEQSYDAILRYRENNSKLEYVGKNRLGTLDLHIIDLISPEGLRTRYEISGLSYKILYINYEVKSDTNAEPVKYRINFRNFTNVQNTLVPYETLVFQNGQRIETRRIVEAVFNIQLDEKSFTAENALKPVDSPPGS